MKYIKTTDTEKVEVGTLIEDCGEFEFQPESTFDDYESAADRLNESNQKYRTLSEVYTVEHKFLNDLVKVANDARKLRDEYAKKAGIVVICKSHYNYKSKLQCYSSDYGSAFDYKGNIDDISSDARQFWANQNYLFGLADGIWELGFTLCWDNDNQTHIIKGKSLKLVITPAK